MTVKNAMNLFRDVQVAEEFRQMADEGYIDTEFNMYGTVYFADGKRHYLISSNEDKILAMMDEAARKGLAPMPLRTLTKTCHVPLGERENIAYEVKLELANTLREDYPLEFLQDFDAFVQVPGSDQAVPLLKEICKKTASIFSKEMLAVTEQLIHYAYSRKTLSRESYVAFEKWVAREKENFEEDTIPKDILHKTWHTLTYVDDRGRLKHLTNARLEWTYHKKMKLEQEGKIVAPVYSKTYWYNNQTSADAIREQHDAYCKEVFGERYMQIVTEIAGYAPAIDPERYESALNAAADTYGAAAAEAMQGYGHTWDLL